MSNKEWHVEPGFNPFSLDGPEFIWRLRDEKGWFELWTKQKDAWRKASISPARKEAAPSCTGRMGR